MAPTIVDKGVIAAIKARRFGAVIYATGYRPDSSSSWVTSDTERGNVLTLR